MEKYKGFEIYYDKEKERFVADKPKLDIHFEARTLWEIKGYIRESQTKEVNKMAYIKSGYFGKCIAKVHILTFNEITKKYKYKVLEDTEDSYDVGRIFVDEDLETIYKITKKNTEIYKKVMEIEDEIKKLEKKQRGLVKKLV